jgi:hypothetical protein
MSYIERGVWTLFCNTRSSRNLVRAVAMAMLLAVSTGCGPSEQPISGALELGPEWTEIAPPSPLRIVKDEQSVRLSISGIADMGLDDSLSLDDGRRVGIAGEVVDDQGAIYPLTLGGIAATRHAYLYRAGEYPPGPDFPPDRTIVKLRLRSDAPLQVEEIRWICTSAH